MQRQRNRDLWWPEQASDVLKASCDIRLTLHRLSLYKKSSTSTGAATSTKAAPTSAKQVPAGPTIVQSVGNYVSQGCWSEATTGRALNAGTFYNDSMTIEMCAQDCKGYAMFGVEYGREWYDSTVTSSFL